MSSKREEVKAFKRLAKEFPDEYVQLEIYYSGCNKIMNKHYTAYHAGVTEAERDSSADKASATPDEAIDALIERRDLLKEYR
ncbi:hypothetical protein [Methanosarcina virus MetMV]|jgi:hypothetical protein|nr:hypothetical protein [Methanosarcina virus MetMV]